jgi:uncharacterized protein with HEPN domain
MTRGHKLFVSDILDAMNAIDDFVKGMDFKSFKKDDKTKSAVVWQIQVIGEAVKNIPKDIRDMNKEIPWKYMARIRDKIAHLYFGIDYEIVWDVVTKNFPEIKPRIQELFKELKARQ